MFLIPVALCSMAQWVQTSALHTLFRLLLADDLVCLQILGCNSQTSTQIMMSICEESNLPGDMYNEASYSA